MRNIATFAFIIFAPIISSASTLETADATKSLCEKSISKIMNSNVNQAFDLLKPNWPVPDAEVNNIAYQTDSQLKLVRSRFGNGIGYEFIKTKSIGQSFLKHIYLGKFEKHAIRFSCIFYKPKNTWLVNSVFWDDKIHEMFE